MTIGKSRKPTDPNYYINAKQKEFEIWEKSTSIYASTKLPACFHANFY